jgi:hypothetical protein
MPFSPTKLLWTTTAILVSVFALRKWVSYRAFHTVEIRHGCQRTRRYLQNDFGYTLTKARAQAVKDGHAMKPYLEDFTKFGKTWEERTYGTTVINTMDKLNMQQVLAHGFQDYRKPDWPNYASFFGKGMISEEGAAWK